MYVKLCNGQPAQYPYTFQDLCRENPGTSFPSDPDNEVLSLFDVQRVVQVEPPAVDGNTHILTQFVALVGETWTQQWEAQPLPVDQAAANVRAERNERLAACDWTQLSDAPTESAAWTSYRQKLRDVTTQPGFPWQVAWPEQPNQL